MDFRIAVFPGDGIGPEVIEACLAVLEKLQARVRGFRLLPERLPGGAAHYLATGDAMPDASVRKAEAADAILFGAMGMPDVRQADGTEIGPLLTLRSAFELYAGVRPVKSYPNAPGPLRDPRAARIDLVVLRESTEGLFASRDKGVVIEDREARDTLVITRRTSERLFRFAFELARKRKARGLPGTVTCVDKSNVFRSLAFFRKIFDECAAQYPDVRATRAYVDATALDMV
ncbi:MAG: isocitrate/isopropylmalate family dehydrogenase, partial [Candidatus Methylomirabilales bacterium]